MLSDQQVPKSLYWLYTLQHVYNQAYLQGILYLICYNFCFWDKIKFHSLLMTVVVAIRWIYLLCSVTGFHSNKISSLYLLSVRTAKQTKPLQEPMRNNMPTHVIFGIKDVHEITSFVVLSIETRTWEVWSILLEIARSNCNNNTE